MTRIIYFMTPLSNGGIEKMIISWIENMDIRKVQIDIVPQGIKNENAKEYLESLGCSIYNMPFRQRNILKKIFFIMKLFKSNKYDVVHVHTSVGFDFLPIMIAKFFSIKTRVMHSHNTNTFKNSFIKRSAQNISKFFIRYFATNFFACSKDAGYSMFGNSQMIKDKLIVIKNGIDIEKFKFDMKVRMQMREKYGLCGKMVFGHIGRFNTQKNHEFLIKVFYEITKLNEDAILLLIGEGELIEACKENAKVFGILDKVKFLGIRNNANEFLQAMDVFIFPSIYEGLGIVLIEAQCSGLPCLVSEHIVEEAMISENIRKYDLRLPALEWAQKALKMSNNESVRENAKFDVINENYSIKRSSELLENFYLNC